MKKNCFLLFALAFASHTLCAQTLLELGPGPTIFIAERDGNKTVVEEIFGQTQSPYFRDPRAPRFLMTDREGKWALGLGGYVQAKLEYDFDGIVDDVDFFPSYIPLQGSSPIHSQTQLDATTSTVFLKLVGRTGKLGNFVLYTAGNWRGAGNTFQLLNAYVQFMGFTLGYSTGMFMDVAACPPTIDYAGPCGMTFYRSTQMGWSYTAKRYGLSMGLGIEAPDVSGSGNRYASVGPQRLPDVPAFVQFAWGQNSHLRLSGIMRNVTYTDLATNKDYDKVGWGAQASAIAGMGSRLSLFGQYTIGEGIGEMLNDISNLSVDIVANPGKEGSMMLLMMDGWYAGMRYNLGRNLFCSATYSQSALHSRNGYGNANPQHYKRGQYVVGNLFWNMTKDVQLGVEYLHGWRTDFNGHTTGANRVNLSAQYNF